MRNYYEYIIHFILMVQLLGSVNHARLRAHYHHHRNRIRIRINKRREY